MKIERLFFAPLSSSDYAPHSSRCAPWSSSTKTAFDMYKLQWARRADMTRRRPREHPSFNRGKTRHEPTEGHPFPTDGMIPTRFDSRSYQTLTWSSMLFLNKKRTPEEKKKTEILEETDGRKHPWMSRSLRWHRWGSRSRSIPVETSAVGLTRR